MKAFSLSLLLVLAGIVSAQNTSVTRVIQPDTTQKLTVLKPSKLTLGEGQPVYRSDWSIGKKIQYFANLLYDKYPILSWMLMLLTGLWLLRLLGRIFSRLRG